MIEYDETQNNEIRNKKLSPAAVAKIIATMNDDKQHVDVRVVAIRVITALLSAGHPDANKTYEKIVDYAATSPDDRIVVASVDALGMLAKPESDDALIKCHADYLNAKAPLMEKDVVVRKAAIQAIHRMLETQIRSDKPDLPMVKKVAAFLEHILSEDPHPDIHELAIRALGLLSDKKFEAEHKGIVTSLLIAFGKKDATPKLKALILETLQSISHLDLGTDPKHWEEWAKTTFK